MERAARLSHLAGVSEWHSSSEAGLQVPGSSQPLRKPLVESDLVAAAGALAGARTPCSLSGALRAMEDVMPPG